MVLTFSLLFLPFAFISHRPFSKWDSYKYNQVFVSACWEGWTNKLVLCFGRNLYWISRILFKLVLKFLFGGGSSFNLANWAPLALCITSKGSCSQCGLSAVAGWKWNGPVSCQLWELGAECWTKGTQWSPCRFLEVSICVSSLITGTLSWKFNPALLKSFSLLSKLWCSDTQKASLKKSHRLKRWLWGKGSCCSWRGWGFVYSTPTG